MTDEHHQVQLEVANLDFVRWGWAWAKRVRMNGKRHRQMGRVYILQETSSVVQRKTTSKWTAKWGAKNEHLERQKPPGWWDGVREMRQLLGEGHSLLDTGMGVGWNRKIHCQRPGRMVHWVLREGQKLPAGRRKKMRPR